MLRHRHLGPEAKVKFPRVKWAVLPMPWFTSSEVTCSSTFRMMPGNTFCVISLGGSSGVTGRVLCSDAGSVFSPSSRFAGPKCCSLPENGVLKMSSMLARAGPRKPILPIVSTVAGPEPVLCPLVPFVLNTLPILVRKGLSQRLKRGNINGRLVASMATNVSRIAHEVPMYSPLKTCLSYGQSR